MLNKAFKILAFTIFGIICLHFFSCNEGNKQTVKPVVITFKKEGELSIKKASSDSIIATFDIEIADDEYQTQTGF
jgi:hypothetical protein